MQPNDMFSIENNNFDLIRLLAALQIAISSALFHLCPSPAAHRVCNQNIKNADHAAHHNRQRQHQLELAVILKHG